MRPVLVGSSFALTLVAILLGPGRTAAEEAMYDPVFREGKPGDVLVKGTPPLHRGNLDAFVDLTEAAFDVAIAASDEQALRDTLEVGFGAAVTDKREGFLSVVRPVESIRESLRKGDADAARAGFEAFRRAVDQRLRDLPSSRANVLLERILARRHEVAWQGTPEIHATAADAYVDLAAFVTSLGRNETVEPTSGQRDALRKDLDAAFRAKEAPLRERLRQAHRRWIYVKARWRAADDARRFRMRWEAVKTVAHALPIEKQHPVTEGSTLADYAKEAAAVAAPIGAFDALGNVAREPVALFEALERGLEVPKDLPEAILLYP